VLTLRRAAGITAALVLILLSACGDDDSPDSSSSPRATAASTHTATPSPRPTPENFEPPARDLLDLARRFRGYPYDAPEVARSQPYNHKVGDTVEFTLIDLSKTGTYTVNATVRAVTDHAYFFVEDSAGYSDSAVTRVAQDFEQDVWPAITGTFGEPPTPGTDADPRITILHADLRGAGGYVSQSNEYPATAVPRSAEREILYLDASAISSPGPTYNSLAAHELQHLVHLAGDDNEEAWVNEGLSEVAWDIAGGSSGETQLFLENPDIQLNDWPADSSIRAHYALSKLFLCYLLDHYGGRDNAEKLTGIDLNGVTGINDYLAPYHTSFTEVFADFVVANVLDASDGPYSHPGFDATTTAFQSISPGSGGDANVSQYGTDYFQVPEGGQFILDGADDVGVGIPDADGPFWWSRSGDGIDSRLTRLIDLSDVDEATLSFDLWHDIEESWDYGYVAVSTDDGRTWEALAGEHTTGDNALDMAYGPGYTGASNGWTGETIDLSAYAGEEILLRFEYVTDDATNLTGMAMDNIAIPEIAFEDGAESTSGWTLEGFRRFERPFPQDFILQVIDPATDRIIRHGNLLQTGASFPVAPGQVIAVSASSNGTTEPASYSWRLQ
jgi:hypothetical protein